MKSKKVKIKSTTCITPIGSIQVVAKKLRRKLIQSVFIFDIDDTMYDQQSAFSKAIHSLDIPNDKILDISHLYQLMKEYGDETLSLGFDKTKLKQMHIDFNSHFLV